MLIANEVGTRSDGESSAEGAPISTRRNMAQTLLFIPADCEFTSWNVPGAGARANATFVSLDLKDIKLGDTTGLNFSDIPPRIHFEDPTIFATVLKLKRLIEDEGAFGSLYAETIGLTLVLELLRWHSGTPLPRQKATGGLAPRHRRAVCDYIEDNLDEDLSLDTLAELVGMSAEHFCRVFRQSLGLPPHRYVLHKRIERAKTILANRAVPITNAALELGFGGSSQFARTFRRWTGVTPSEFRKAFD
jgi:AraC family transcriptional regulator